MKATHTYIRCSFYRAYCESALKPCVHNSINKISLVGLFGHSDIDVWMSINRPVNVIRINQYFQLQRQSCEAVFRWYIDGSSVRSQGFCEHQSGNLLDPLAKLIASLQTNFSDYSIPLPTFDLRNSLVPMLNFSDIILQFWCQLLRMLHAGDK